MNGGPGHRARLPAVDYLLTAEVVPPDEAPDLDALQQAGVAAMLDTRLNGVANIDGPDDVEVMPLEHEVAAHARGSTVRWLLDAPALAFAEEATRAVLEQLLEDTEVLADWRVERCTVTPTDDQLEQALHGDEVDDQDGALEDGPGDEVVTEEELEMRRRQLLEAAGQLGAFGLDAFGYDPDSASAPATEDEARLVAGALVQGVALLTDQLFDDVQVLEEELAPASEVDALWVLDELPARYLHRYTPMFARRFLIAATILGHRLTQPGWVAPWSTAEALALHVAKSKAELLLELGEVLESEKVKEIFEVFDEFAFEDADHEWLYTPDDDDEDSDGSGIGALAFEEWFRPYTHLTDAEALHPYLAEDAEAAEPADSPESVSTDT